ncbi:glycine betaine ABC transporter substrate-binding protein [Prochlorothrix hollandica]|uniref:glycine betaine ABC transporter substrate-binding protein n=1 Tax=Prochlorothrix hollandica TaxID=1223 RepID=UPI00333F9BDA
MTQTRRRVLQGILGLTLASILPACGGDRSTNETTETTIRIGSKDFIEQLILGEMYALALEQEGFKVDRVLNLGGTPVAQAALRAGDIDLYPEYTGTGLLTVLKLPSDSDPQGVYTSVKEGYKRQFNLVWLDPAPLNNTNALAMTRSRAQELGITTLSDFAAQAQTLTLIGAPEFEVREDGLPGLQQVYGPFSLGSYKAVDSGLRYQGLLAGDGDVAVAYTTDGEISAFDLVLLEDDRQFFPPYQVAPVVRQDTLDAHPTLADTLNRLSPLLTTAVMQDLNNAVSGQQQEPAAVARSFLVQQGVIPE